MKPKRTQDHLNQLVLDFYSLVEAGVSSAPTAVAAAPEVSTTLSDGLDAGPREVRREEGAEYVAYKEMSKRFEVVLERGVTPDDLSTAGETNLLHYLAAHNRLGEVPRNLLTAENLSVPDEDGNTPCHFAAANGSLAELPKSALTVGLLTTQNDDGRNPLHAAVEAGKLEAVPDVDGLVQALTQADRWGLTPVELADASGQTTAQPEPGPEVDDFAADQAVLEASRVFENLMLESGNATPEVEDEEFGADDPDEVDEDKEFQRANPAAAAAEEALAALYDKYTPPIVVEGKPVSELTTEDLMTTDENGEPALFAVILNGRVDELAPGVVTEETCLIQDSVGNTAAHLVARYCENLPEAFGAALTERTLSVPDVNGRTPAHEFARAGMINLLPEEALTAAVLTTPDDDGVTAAEYARACGEPCRLEVGDFALVPVAVGPAIQVPQPEPYPAPDYGRGMDL